MYWSFYVVEQALKLVEVIEPKPKSKGYTVIGQNRKNTPKHFKTINHTNPSNMKNILLGGLITIITLSLLSYTTTEGKGTSGLVRIVHNIPLKQKRVITTDDIVKVNKLLKQGYRVEFVTENWWNSNGSKTTYTLILY